MSEIIEGNFRQKIEKQYGPGTGPGESTIHNSNEYNQGTAQKQLVHEYVNSGENWKLLIDAIKSGRARDISDEPKVEKIPCFVIGSGPSLDDSIEHLKEWKGGIICSTSHALSFMYHGIEPSHILVLDPFCIDKEIEGVDWSKTKTKMITHPGAHPSILKCWPNEILLYLQNNGRADSFYANVQKLMYSHREGESLREPVFHFYIRTEMMLFACSPPMQLFVADKLGYGNIFLAGCDFAYHKDKARFTDYTANLNKWNYDNLIIEAQKIKERGCLIDDNYELFWDRFNAAFNKESPKLPIWEKHEHPYARSSTEKISNNGMPTEEIHLYYKKNFLSAWRLSLQQMYTTDHGAVTEIPYADIKKVIRKQGLDFPKQSKQWISKTVELYLASVNAFVVETELGIAFVETLDYKRELPLFMANFKKNYSCPKCGIKITANDGKEHVGEPCPNCKEGIINYVNKIDIEANMQKFTHLYNMTHEVVEEPLAVNKNGEAISIREHLIGEQLEKSLKE